MSEQTKTAHEARAEGPVIHRVCEACNNMFPTRAGDPERRCPKCRKE